MTDETIKVSELTYMDLVALYAKHGSESATARALGVSRTTLQSHFYKVRDARFISRRMKEARKIEPDPDQIRYFIFSSAQDNTAIHHQFLKNLEAYAEFRDAEIIISGFTYDKSLYEDHRKEEATFYPEIAKYLDGRRILLGDGLMFCGEMNTLPTAVNPLSGFETYTGASSGIFPHPKVHLTSIPTSKGEPCKMILTTGAVTLPNYIQKKAGIKAEFNHEIGAVIVEPLPTGQFFVRHLLAEEDGTFYDFKFRVKDGEITVGDWVEAVNWGDIHEEKNDNQIAKFLWDTDLEEDRLSMLDYLVPNYQFIHDTMDFTYRNHHNINDPHFRFEMFTHGTETVRDSILKAQAFLNRVYRWHCTTVVVESNHDLALLKWLKTADYRTDPVNAEYFLLLQRRVYQAIREREKDFQIFPWALQQEGDFTNTIFLKEDDSFLIAGDIECGMHGHNGANGVKPTPRQFSRMGRKSNTGHTHSASIIDGCYTAGISGSIDQGYNKGLSSWSHSHIVTYINGKRTIVTQIADGHYCGDTWVFRSRSS